MARLENLAEIGHYGAIYNYVRVLEPRSILDVGCGHGLLISLLRSLPYESYLGLDLSPEAIRMAGERHTDARTTFIVADADAFLCDQTFDLIIFNECLYYMKDPRGLLMSYARWLRPGGHILVSMYISPENKKIWRLLDGDFILKDSMVAWNLRISGGWSVGLLLPAGAPGARDGELDLAAAGSPPTL
ncbi:MAG TPA: class I SAM-dependent methyltransferase [Acidobacteriaceae bacterium]|nr:class I SAM-dependent methyltransferase [Acidobacteriaceae bacterium]